MLWFGVPIHCKVVVIERDTVAGSRQIPKKRGIPRWDPELTGTDDDNVEHVIKPNLMHPLWQTRKASTNNKAYRSVGYCSVCHQKCGFYCATCSDDCSCVSVCNPTGSNFQCFLNHQKSTIEDSNSKYRFKSKARRVTP